MVRLWKLNSEWNLQRFQNYIKKSVNEYRSYEYKIKVDGSFIFDEKMRKIVDDIEIEK